jgi:XTP/dITP diphosphohydrolase
LKGLEIQSKDLKEIARASVVCTVKKSGCPTFVEDAGLYVTALRGFPGAFTSHAYQTIGNRGLLKLLDGVKDRRAVFKSAIAYCAPHKKPICFTGEVHGNISLKERGIHGFGFDPIFEPDDGGGKTFGELGEDEKNRYSHRAIAVRRFADWLLTHCVD